MDLSRVPQDPPGEDPGEGMSTGAAALQAEEALPPSANCQQCAHSPFCMFAGENISTLTEFRALAQAVSCGSVQGRRRHEGRGRLRGTDPSTAWAAGSRLDSHSRRYDALAPVEPPLEFAAISARNLALRLSATVGPLSALLRRVTSAAAPRKRIVEFVCHPRFLSLSIFANSARARCRKLAHTSSSPRSPAASASAKGRHRPLLLASRRFVVMTGARFRFVG